MHSVLKVSPFEAAHGLPARGVQNHPAAADYAAPDYLGTEGIRAMQSTAAGFATLLRQVQEREAKERAELLNLKGSAPKLKVGDKVVFFIPPTAEEAELAKRKAKHMPRYRGPATIVKVMTPTTFELKHNNRTYQRCLSELRRYRAAGQPLIDVGVAPDTATSFEVGAYIAYRDNDDPNDDSSSMFHVGKVINVADGQAQVHCHATTGKSLARAKWAPLYQQDDGTYTLAKGRRREAVEDHIPVDEEEWVMHYDVKLDAKRQIIKQTRKQLASMKVKHHRLGTSFP